MSKKLLGLRPSVYISGMMAAGIGLWLWSATWSSAETDTMPQADTAGETASPEAGTQDAKATAPIVTVRTMTSTAVLHQASLSINGQTDYDRKVVIRSETMGRIASVDMEESHPVDKGKVIARIELDDRQAKLDQAKALLAQREIQFSAAKKLAKRGFQSEIKRAEAAANLSAAKTALRQAQIDLNNTAIRSSFAGTVQIQSVEVGDYVEANTEIATIIDLDPIYVKGQVSEREISAIEMGTIAHVTLISGQQVDGIVSRIAPVANSETRTFEVAVEVPNPDNRIPAGITASLKLPSKQIQAHKISPALLTLNDAGQVGIKTVDAQNTVQFKPVFIIEDLKNGMWVAGLPSKARIITVGQEYVRSGQTVEASSDDKIN